MEAEAMALNGGDLGDLRALIARHMVQKYWLAAMVKIHPGRLGMMLNGKVPMPTDVAERISAVVMGMDSK